MAGFLTTFPAIVAMVALGLGIIAADIAKTRENIASLERTYIKSLGAAHGDAYRDAWFCEEFCVPSRW